MGLVIQGHLGSSRLGFSKVKVHPHCPGTFKIQSLVLGWSLGLCISGQLPEDSCAAGAGAPLWG